MILTNCLGQLLAASGTAEKLGVATCRQQEVLAAAQAEGSVQGVNSSLAADLVQATVQQAQTMRQVPTFTRILSEGYGHGPMGAAFTHCRWATAGRC